MKINHPLVTGEVIKLLPHIYAVIIKDDFERSMLFCRYQEFYESPFPEIKGNDFTIEEYMNVYRKKKNRKVFTYPVDWVGYNLPSNEIENALSVFDFYGPYDGIMEEIWEWCNKKSKGKSFYVIGTNKKQSKIMNHELAHGLYYTNEKYHNSVDELIEELPKKLHNFVSKELRKLGYRNDVKIINDEINAFFSTGLHGSFDTPEICKHTKKHRDLFKQTLNGISKKDNIS